MLIVDAAAVADAELIVDDVVVATGVVINHCIII